MIVRGLAWAIRAVSYGIVVVIVGVVLLLSALGVNLSTGEVSAVLAGFLGGLAVAVTLAFVAYRAQALQPPRAGEVPQANRLRIMRILALTNFPLAVVAALVMVVLLSVGALGSSLTSFVLVSSVLIAVVIGLLISWRQLKGAEERPDR